MWGPTFADLFHRYRQFLIAVLGAGVVLAMALLLSGLAASFGEEIDRTINAVGATSWVMPVAAEGRITAVDLMPQSEVSTIAREPGVRSAAPLVVLPQQQLGRGDRSRTVIVIGVGLGAMGDPSPRRGRPLTASGQVLVDSATHARIGTPVLIDGSLFQVVGTVSDRTMLGGVPVVYVPTSDAQRLGMSGRPLVTAVVTSGVPATVPSGLQAGSDTYVAKQTLSLLAGGVKSINNSKFLMWAVAAIIVAALLYVSALQRARDFAVLKALGSSSGALFASLAIQSVVVTLAAAALGVVLCNFMHGLFAQPVDVPTSAYAYSPLVALVVGFVASLVALRTATKADPAAAFGG